MKRLLPRANPAPKDTFEAFVSPLKLPMSDHARTLAERFCDQVRSLFDERDTVSEAVRRLSHDATEVWYELQTSKEDRCAMIIEMEAYHAALYGQFDTQAGLVSDLGVRMRAVNFIVNLYSDSSACSTSRTRSRLARL